MSVVEVILVPVTPGAADDPELIGRLGAGEREAVAALGFAADRDRAVTARAAARLELGRRLGMPPQRVPLSPPAAGGGRPLVARSSLGVGWSHSGAWVAVALAADRPVAVDIERIPRRLSARALARVGAGSLREFVAREAASKVTGRGLWDSWPPEVGVRPFTAPAGYLAAVAAPGEDWSLRVRGPGAPGSPASASAVPMGVWPQAGAAAGRAALGRR